VGRLPQSIRIAGIYLIVSLIWIVTSDTVVVRLVADPSAQLFLNTTKGWAFVAVTTGLLWAALERDRRSVAAEAAARAEAEQRSVRLGKLYQVLGETGEAILGLAGGRDILPEACRIAVEVAGFRMAWVGMVDPRSGLVEPVAHAGHVDGFFEGLRISVDDTPEGQGPTGRAVRSGLTMTSDDLTADPTVPLLHDRVVALGYRGAASAPLRRDGRVVGAFVAYSAEVGYFTPDVVEQFERIAGAVSFGLEFQRREEERRAAYEQLEAYGQELEARVLERTDELRMVAERLADSDAAKSAFLANMSHELRTPLNSIIGFSGVLLQGMTGELTPEQRMQIEIVNRSGLYLLSLVNDVLDLSRIEAGRARLDLSDFDLVAMVDDAVGSLRPLAEEKSLRLTTGMPDEPLPMHSDRGRLLQSVLNLLSNAVKFTAAGEVHVGVRTVGRDRVAVTVTDTGAGIAEDKLANVFEEFYQIEGDEGAKSRGTGLGLAITRRLVEMLGGKVLVRSTPGEGSVFEVVVPTALPDPAVVE